MIHTKPPTIPTDQPTAQLGAIRPAADVQKMFDQIADRYDLLNHLLSVGFDRLWWKRAARTLAPILARPDAIIVDLCCGTGDMTAALNSLRSSTSSTEPLFAVDFSSEMLSRASLKYPEMNIIWVEADAVHLPLTGGSADLISAAFGFRNLPDYSLALEELFRVLRPGGEIAILECNQPRGIFGYFYSLYFKKILPTIGGLFSSGEAYRYLPASVERFPQPTRMLELIHKAGFHNATWTSYTLGVAGLYRAVRPLAAESSPFAPQPAGTR